MYTFKSTISIFIALFLTACHPLPQPVQMTDAVVHQSVETVGITERAAFELLIAALEQRPNSDLDCLQFLPESDNDDNVASDWEFAAFEVHDDICGGDPDVSHVRNRYKINADGSIMLYDVRDAEYQPL